MVHTPKVSVLIPTYNSASFLSEAIESVLNQTFTDFELIIQDNNSDDHTEEVVKKYLPDTRVSYHKNAVNIGMAGNWNKVLTHARGEYIKFLMSDDKFHPQLLEKFVPIMDQNPNVSLITSYREEFGLENYKNEPPFIHLQPGKKIICETLKDRNWLGEPTTVMFRRSNLFLGDFNTNYTYILDWDMWLRHLSIGDCYILPQTLSYFRVHSKQVTKTALKQSLNYFEVYEFYKKVRDENPYRLDFGAFDIDSLVKQKATKCANAIPKIMFKPNRQGSLKLLMKATKIIIKEKVFFISFVQVLKQVNKKFVVPAVR